MVIIFEIVYAEEVVKKDIPSLSVKQKELIKQAIENKLRTNPMFFGKPLRYSLKPLRRLRAGDFRVVFMLGDQIVKILAIQHRSVIYQNLKKMK